MMNYSTPYQALQDTIVRYNNGKPTDQQLPRIPFHGLRHTSATLLIANQQDVKTVSKRLGHAQTSTTMNIYTHLDVDSKVASANAIIGIFPGERKCPSDDVPVEEDHSDESAAKKRKRKSA